MSDNFFLIVFYLWFYSFLITQSLSSRCFYDETLDPTSNKCTRCSSYWNGCLLCSFDTTTFICMECLPGFSPVLTSNKITSCTEDCTEPETFLNIPNKTIRSSKCQILLWLNKQSEKYVYTLEPIASSFRQTSTLEVNALKELYISLNGDWWTNRFNWNINDPCESLWYGIRCNKRGNVIGISFNQNNIQGIIPDIISDLHYWEYIHIVNPLFVERKPMANYIYSLSSNLFSLPNLKEIVFKNVNIYQTFDNIISINTENTSLEVLDLSFNHISGNIVENVKYLKALKVWNLANNSISSNWDNLNILTNTVFNIQLQNNVITGQLPELNNLISSLQVFDVRNNTLTGTIPTKFFSDSYFHNLNYIGLMWNKIEIPNECKNTPFCIKRWLINSESIDDPGFELTQKELQYLIPRS